MKKIIRNSNEGISFMGAIGAIIWYDLILSTIITAIVFGIIRELTHIKANTIPGAWMDEFKSVAMSIITILLMLKYLRKKGLSKLSVVGTTNINLFIFIVLFFTGYVLFSGNTIDLLISQIPTPKIIEDAFRKIMSNNYLMIFSMAVSAPIFEEIICRGIILELFLKRYKDLAAVVLSAIFFGLLHMNIQQFIGAFIAGMILGYIYLKTKSLIACMLGHFCHNFTICIISIMKFGADDKFNLLQLLIGIILIALSFLVIRNNLSQNRVNEVQLGS